MTADQPTRPTQDGVQTLRACRVSQLQWAVSTVPCVAAALAILSGAGAAVPALAAVCALGLLLSIGFLFEAQGGRRP